MSEQQRRNDGNSPVITFDHVTKAFGSDRKVLDDVSFTLLAGETLCILGRSGTGKSVTLKLMIGLLKPDSGKVLIEDSDIACIDRRELSAVRRRMGYMFQNGALFDSFNLHDNLALPLHHLNRTKSSEEIEHAVQEALQQVGLEKDGDKMPVALSGGMQKRAGLARALVLQPEILLVDEPSSGLDRVTSSEIDDLLMKVRQERHTTMVIVTHDILGARRLGDKFAVLDRGKLIGYGTPAELDKSDDKVVQQFISES